MPKSLSAPQSRAELLTRLAALSPESRPAWGKMSVGQMLCHLLYVVPWPKGAPTAPELLSTAPGEFAADADRLRSLMERVAEGREEGPWPEHPLFGRLSGAQWGHLAYRHIDHHFRQFGI